MESLSWYLERNRLSTWLFLQVLIQRSLRTRRPMACKCGLLIMELSCHLESRNVYQQDEAFILGRTIMVKTVMQIQFKTKPQLLSVLPLFVHPNTQILVAVSRKSSPRFCNSLVSGSKLLLPTIPAVSIIFFRLCLHAVALAPSNLRWAAGSPIALGVAAAVVVAYKLLTHVEVG